MKSLLKVPRVFLPRKEFEPWAVPLCSSRDLWERIERTAGEEPSAVRFLLPPFDEDDDARLASMRAGMFFALEEEWMEKLNRGIILTERVTLAGIRRGLVAALDLEQFSYKRGERAPARVAQEADLAEVRRLAAARGSMPLEFSHTIALYRDKKSRIMKEILRLDLELLYDFDLMEGGGHLRGWFIPDDIAVLILGDLQRSSEPCFLIADGGEEAAAAKEVWEALKPTLKQEELATHPARFILTEFVNVFDEGLDLRTVHRAVKDIEQEALFDYFMKNMKCKRSGNLLLPTVKSADMVRTVDTVLQNFVRQNGGRIVYVQDEQALKKLAEEEDCAGILLPPIERDLFALKDILPQSTFTVGGETGGRYSLEGREISYD